MKRILLICSIFVALFSLSGCLPKKQTAALQVDSFPPASVFLNGKLIGKTPFVDRELNPGEINLKLIPESTASAFSSWEGKLKLVGGVMSVVNREFAETEEESAGDILTLEPLKDKKVASLAVISSPDGVMVKLDGENRGFTPLVLDKVSEGEHQIILSFSGYKEQSLKARAINGYKLIVNSQMAKEKLANATTTPSPTPKVTGSPQVKLTPTPKVTGSPQIQPSPKPTLAITGASVVIKQTETGWLRVRSGPGKSFAELGKVNPGDKFPLLEEKTGWYKINYEENKEGWISSDYADKME